MLKRGALFAGLLGICATLNAQARFVREGDEWHFLRGIAPPPLEWAQAEFDPEAAGWESGPTGIGYGDDDDATLLLDMQGSYVSVYCRTGFDVPEGLEGFIFALRVRYDDGFVAYIDGEEVARRGLAGTPPSFDELAVSHDIADPAGFDETIAVDVAGYLLTPGEHVLAAQVHNTAVDSSDLSFSAELVVTPILVTSISPSFGPLEGGNVVTISGLGFRVEDPPQVRFGDRNSEIVEVVSSQELRAVAPPSPVPALVDMEVEDSRGGVVLSGAYRYVAARQTGLAFNGTAFATANSFGDVSTEGTFELWFRRAEEGFRIRRTVMAVEAAGGGDAFRLEVRNDQVRARTLVGEETADLTGDGFVGDDTWHHLAFAYSPGGRRIYLDGREIAADTFAMVLPEETRLRVGNRFAGDIGFFGLSGQVESVRVWSLERSPEEIGRFPFRRYESADRLESAWYLDEGEGPAAVNRVDGGAPLFLGETAAAEEADPSWTFLEGFPELAIIRIEPDAASRSGGGMARIFGVGFAGETAPDVLFGETLSPQVNVRSDWELEAEIPAAEGFGEVTVSVRTSEGVAELPGGFSYEPGDIVTAVREGDVWHYFVATEAPPEGWAGPDFAPGDFGWQSGPTGIGYGDGDDATEVAEMQNLAVTLYARIEWSLDGTPETVDFLRLRIRYDDGYVAYLNGGEVGRVNVAGEPPAFDETASDLHEITAGPGEFDEELDLLGRRDLLREGRNVLAIEVHNFTIDSSDLSLSAELAHAGGGPSVVTFIRGDSDRSGSITVTDGVRILLNRFLGGADLLPCMESADADDDGFVDVTDAIFLLDYLFRGGPRPPSPYPEAGRDLDGDSLDCER